MKTVITILLVAGLYGCIAASVAVYGIKAGALTILALVLMGILEGIV